jgi:hypothetical protein
VIVFIRLVGIVNAAVWLGGAVFFTFGIGSAPFSEEMKTLLSPANFPYYSGAVAQILVSRYFSLHVICGAIALAHLATEWLYLGRPVQRFTLTLVLTLFGLGLLGSLWLQPRMRQLHVTKYATNASTEDREAAAKDFRVWHGLSQGINAVALVGLVFYLWRVNHPADPTRLLAPVQYPGLTK